MNRTGKRVAHDLVISLLPALVLLGISHRATREHWGVSTGFPLDYSHYNSGCLMPNPFNGCGYSYDLVLVGLDFLFWLALAFTLTLTIDVARFHHSKARSATEISGGNQRDPTPIT